jgi:hypothetical protein
MDWKWVYYNAQTLEVVAAAIAIIISAVTLGYLVKYARDTARLVTTANAQLEATHSRSSR